MINYLLSVRVYSYSVQFIYAFHLTQNQQISQATIFTCLGRFAEAVGLCTIREKPAMTCTLHEPQNTHNLLDLYKVNSLLPFPCLEINLQTKNPISSKRILVQ